MQIGTPSHQRRTLTLAALLAATGCATRAQQSPSESTNVGKINTMSQDTTSKKTHCLGRYLIDLPADAEIKASFKYAGGIVETRRNITRSIFEQMVSVRESNLKSTSHKLGGNMLVGRTSIGDDKILLQSWVDATTTQNAHKNETFIYVKDKSILFLRNTESDSVAQLRTIERAKMIAGYYRHRNDNEVPTEAGFCINSGLITSKNINSEEFTSNVIFKQSPGMSASITSMVTGNPAGSMLSRMEREMTFLDKSVLAAMTVLRKKARAIGPVEGEEFLVAAIEDGKKGYQFVWSTQGKANSIEFPSMTIRLTTARLVNNEIAAAPFKTDREALEMWDSLLNSLRLRPGAV
jgi:Tle cognate immunity protein 4 C-terminal domain/Tle cognate immunity protein 4 N-terminal domain